MRRDRLPAGRPTRWSSPGGLGTPNENLTTASHHRVSGRAPGRLTSKQLHTHELAPRFVLPSSIQTHVVHLSPRARHNHAMAAKDGERSASSATRFTATTPHASSKARAAPPHGVGGPRKPIVAARASTPNSESPEQRVARLRAAHEKAKTAQVSRFDQLLAKSRPFFDSAHRITVISLVGLTGTHWTATAPSLLRTSQR